MVVTKDNIIPFITGVGGIYLTFLGYGYYQEKMYHYYLDLHKHTQTIKDKFLKNLMT